MTATARQPGDPTEAPRPKPKKQEQEPASRRRHRGRARCAADAAADLDARPRSREHVRPARRPRPRRRRPRPARAAVVEGAEGSPEDRGLPREGHPHGGRHALAPRPLRWRGAHQERGEGEPRHAPRVHDVVARGVEPAQQAADRGGAGSRPSASRPRQRRRSTSAATRSRRSPTTTDDYEGDPLRDNPTSQSRPTRCRGVARRRGAAASTRCRRWRRRMMIRAMRMLFTPPDPSRRVVHGGAHPARRPRLVRRAHARPHRRPPLPLRPRARRAPLRRPRAPVDHAARVGRGQGADSLKSYLATLDLVAALDGVKLGLPAHGHPFDDVPGRVEAIKEHHQERMELIAEASPSARARDGAGPLARDLPEEALGRDGRERDVRPPRAHGARR